MISRRRVMTNNEKLAQLETSLRELYSNHEDRLLFHGWHHITFVRVKAKIFAEEIGADTFLVQSAALVHDMNYIVQKDSSPEEGKVLRQKYLIDATYAQEEVDRIEQIVMEEHTATRNEKISDEGKALSDADTLFKALPITPIIFASKYIQENDIDIHTLAEKICIEQNNLMESDIYFYTPMAREMYLGWAKTNLALWNNVRACLEDNDVKDMLGAAPFSRGD